MIAFALAASALAFVLSAAAGLGGSLILVPALSLAYGAKGVEPLHLQITRQPDGRYAVEDNRSRTGTQVNGAPISGPTVLKVELALDRFGLSG